MVIGEELSRIIEILKDNGNDNPYFEAHLIFRHILKLSPTDLVLSRNKEISEESIEVINRYVKRRINHEPLQYILNSQEFMGINFYVDENVLIPRQDTETLVEHILEHFKGEAINAIDIGTGSGCIAVSIAKFNKKAFFNAVDISEKALEVAKRNAEDNGVSDRINFVEADIFTYEPYGKYDLIVSNPPYIKSADIEGLQQDVNAFEPHGALDGGDTGLSYYERIVKISPKLLNINGMLAFEVGFDQAEDVKKLMEKDFCDIKIIKDLCKVERVVSGIYKGNSCVD